jgi:hypothetical protein
MTAHSPDRAIRCYAAADATSTVNLLGVALAVLLSALCTTLPAAAQDQAALPAAEHLLNAYVEAMGGADAYAEIKTLASTGTMVIDPLGLTGSLSVAQARPDQLAMTFFSEAIGSLRSGVDHGIAWEASDIMGPRILQGEERRFALQTAAIDGLVAWRDMFTSAETVGSAEVDGTPCWTLRMTTSTGDEQTWFLDRKSQVLRKIELDLETALGVIGVSMVLDDYREVGGVLIPYRTVSAAQGQQMVITIDSIEVNTELDDATFEPPPEIEELLEQEATSEAEPAGTEEPATTEG